MADVQYDIDEQVMPGDPPVKDPLGILPKTSSTSTSSKGDPLGILPKNPTQQPEIPEPVNPIKTLRDLNKVATTPPPTTTTIIDPTMGGSITESNQKDIDTQTKAKSDYDNQIQSLAKSWGIKSEDLTKVINDFPNDDDPNKIKERLQLLSDNPKTYERQRAATENTYLLANSGEGGIHTANEYNASQEQPGEYVPLHLKEGRLGDQINKISSTLSGDEKGKALDNLESVNAPLFNVTNPDIAHEYSISPFKDKLDATQFAALEQLKIFHPDKYQQYTSILTTPVKGEMELTGHFDPISGQFTTGEKETEETTDQKIGLEKVKQELANQGRNNTFSYLQEKQYDLEKAYKSATDPVEQQNIQAEYLKTLAIQKGLQDDAKKDGERYPYSQNLKFDNQVKELTQDPGMNALEYGIGKFGTGLEKSGNSIENVLTSLFGSDEANNRLQMRKLGQSEQEASDFYLPENLKQTKSPFVYSFDKSLKNEATKIQNDNSLTDEQKQQKLTDLVKNNTSKVDYVTNPDAGKSANFFSKATLYGNAGTLGDIASIAVQSLGLGGAGAGRLVSAALPMFLSSQDDFYKEAVKDGNPNPSAYANLHGTVMALAGLINPDINIVKNAVGLESKTGKMLAGLSEDTWNNIVNENKPLLNKIKNSAKAVLGESAKMGAVYGAGTSIANDLINKGFFNKNISGEDIVNNAVRATKDITINSLGLFGLNAISHFKETSLEQKARIWDIGHNPSITLDHINDAVKTGDITKQEGEQRSAIVKQVAKLIDKVPTQDAKGNPLTDKQKVNYLYNLMVKSKIADIKSDLPEAQQEKLQNIDKGISIDNSSILDPKSLKENVSKGLAEIKFPETSLMKPYEGKGDALIKYIQEQGTGHHLGTNDVGSPDTFNTIIKEFPEHLVEGAIKLLPDETKQFLLEMYDHNDFKVPEKLRNYLQTSKIKTNEEAIKANDADAQTGNQRQVDQTGGAVGTTGTAPSISVITIKPKENAVSISPTNEMDVRQQASDGKGVGSGDTKSEVPPGQSTEPTGQPKKEGDATDQKENTSTRVGQQIDAAFAGGKISGKIIKDEDGRLTVQDKKGYKYPIKEEDILKEGETPNEHYENKKKNFDNKIDAFADKWVDKLTPKGMKGVAKQGIGIDDVIKGGAKIIKAAYHAGTDIRQAVEAAINHIKNNWDNSWGKFDEDEFRNKALANIGDKKEYAKPIQDLMDSANRDIEFTGDPQKDRNIIEGVRDAMVLHAKNIIKSLPPIFRDAKLQENVYHNMEDPSFPLNEAEKQFRDEYVRPIQSSLDGIYQKIKNQSPEMEKWLDTVLKNEIGYVPREVKGKNGVIDKAISGVKGLFGSNAKTTSGHLKSRLYKAFTDENGDRKVVYSKDGKFQEVSKDKFTPLGDNNHRADEFKDLQKQKLDLTANIKNEKDATVKKDLNKQLSDVNSKISEINKERETNFVDKEGKKWKIGDATVKEIESSSPTQYYKTPLANFLNASIELKQVEMANSFIDNMKDKMQNDNLMFDLKNGKMPDGYATTDFPSFKGYAFPKPIAAELNRISGQGKTDPLRALTIVNTFYRNAIVFGLGIKHWMNEMNVWLKEGGLSRWAHPGRFAKTSMQAVKALALKTPEYYQLLENGASLMSHNTKNYPKLILEAANEQLKDKTTLQKVSDALGYANPAKLLKAISNFSHQSAMGSHDLFMMQAVFEQMAKGKNMRDAIDYVNKYIPDYDIPSTILGSEGASKLLRNPNLTMFSSYHYGLFKSYGNMIKDLAKGTKEGDIKKIGEASDKIAMAALISAVGYPIMNSVATSIANKVFGDKDDKKKIQFRPAGSSKLEQDAYKLTTGQEGLSQYIYSNVTPAQGTELLMDLILDKATSPYEDQKPYIPSDLTKHPTEAAKDAGGFALNKFAPYQQINAVQSGKKTGTQLLEDQFDIQHASTPEQRRYWQLRFEKNDINEKVFQLRKVKKDAEAQKVLDQYHADLEKASQEMGQGGSGGGGGATRTETTPSETAPAESAPSESLPAEIK